MCPVRWRSGCRARLVASLQMPGPPRNVRALFAMPTLAVALDVAAPGKKFGEEVRYLPGARNAVFPNDADVPGLDGAEIDRPRIPELPFVDGAGFGRLADSRTAARAT